MSPGGWREWAAAELDAVRAAGRWRETRELDGRGPVGRLGDRTVVAYASNDYLGLTAHPAVIAAAHDALDRWGTGSGASRLVTGSRPIHRDLETELASWKRTERALVFPTGFAANLGVLSVMADPATVVCSDELNHASIIDGCRLGRAEVAVYRHADVGHVGELLQRARRGGRRAVVVSDTVFSMDGDVAPVVELAAACESAGALLVLDDAHSVLDVPAVPEGCEAEVLRVGTLSKALGSLGGFVAGAAPMIDLLVNRARPFIFTTAPTPADAAAALAALRLVRGAEGERLRGVLRAHVERLRPGHPSPIVPVVIGEEGAALAASDALLERGIFVPAIRPPTVAPGTSRLRVALSAAHTDEQVAALCGALEELHVPA